MWMRRVCLYGCVLLVFCAACASGDVDEPRPALTREQLLDPNTCKDCHPRHYAEWSASMHAYASKDPVFLAMNRRGQEETAGELGRFCVECHMPMAARENEIADLTRLEDVPEHLQGVTCYFCHNATSFGAEHNNANITLANDNTMRAAIDRALIPSVHRVQFSDVHNALSPESSVMCGTCHDIVNQAGFHLERTLAEYQTTFFATDQVRFASCQGCHMRVSLQAAAVESGIPGVFTGPRNVHEHLFAAVDIPLTPFPGADAMRAAVEGCELPRSLAFVQVELASLLGSFTVRLETGAGHALPSGATQDRRMWLEVEGYDESDTLVFSSGQVADGELEETPGNKHPCLFRDRVLDADGAETHDFWEAVQTEDSFLIPPPTSALAGTHFEECSFGVARGRPLARIVLRMRLRPIGLDVLRDLIETGHLASDVEAAMPTLTVDTRTARFNPETRLYQVDEGSEPDCETYRTMLE